MAKKPAIIQTENLFKELQNRMRASIETGRYIPHEGEKGSFTEAEWIEWLRYYLPPRYRVDKAFVIDCDGQKSDQIDIVIYDGQYSHLFLNLNNQKLIPAESVYAVIEVKQDLRGSSGKGVSLLQYAGEKAASVRKLKRTSAAVRQIDGSFKKKKLHHILAGIVALKSSWADPLGPTFEKNLKQLPPERRLDFGCALENGAFWAEYDETSSELKAIKRSTPEESLIFFFLELLMGLQNIGNAPAIDLKEYAKNLNAYQQLSEIQAQLQKDSKD